jgi:hypothetical protein
MPAFVFPGAPLFTIVTMPCSTEATLIDPEHKQQQRQRQRHHDVQALDTYTHRADDACTTTAVNMYCNSCESSQGGLCTVMTRSRTQCSALPSSTDRSCCSGRHWGSSDRQMTIHPAIASQSTCFRSQAEPRPARRVLGGYHSTQLSHTHRADNRGIAEVKSRCRH